MKASIKNIEQTIASEQYRPALSEEYQELFQRLTRRLEDTLPMNRARIISDELRRVSETAREADLDCQKYMAALSVLVDLSLQGWIFDFQDHQFTLRMENDNIDDKEKIRLWQVRRIFVKSSLVNVLVLERISFTFLSFSASSAVGIATTSTNSLGR